MRNLLHALFAHALRFEFGFRNPITPVRASSQRLRDPEFLDGSEFQALIGKLNQQVRVMVLLAGSTGMRRSELIGLRWKDLSSQFLEVSIKRSVWRGLEWNCKTKASRKPVPLHPFILDQLQDWRRSSPWNGDEDFVFPSVRLNGKKPISPDMVLRSHIRPALKELGVKKRIGWHSFRHGLGTMLRRQGIDLKTAQELLRHANSRITNDLYQQALSEEKHLANAIVVKALLGESLLQHPKTPSEGA